jgi:hypothetical protein
MPCPCSNHTVRNYWRGLYCRCCGAQLHAADGIIVGCNRPHFNLGVCPHCEQDTCGPHSCDIHGQFPVRRHCELCGLECEDDGACPVHLMQEA